MRLPVILWMNGMGWERDFFYDIFPNSSFHHLFMRDDQISYDNSTMGALRAIGFNIQNAGSNNRYDCVRERILQYKPALLIHTADEYMGGKWKYGEATDLFPLVPLVLRSYSIAYYRGYDVGHFHSNVIQLPLGYATGMLRYNTSSNCGSSPNGTKSYYRLSSTETVGYSMKRLSSSRNLTWSFVGEYKVHKGRWQGIEVFSTWGNNFVSSDLSPPQMRDVYNNSKFVLVGHGQVSLDCFRIYEAIISGAIPIVIAKDSDFEKVFEYEGAYIPLIYADNVYRALEICKSMTDTQIDYQREQLGNWFLDRMALISRLVSHYMKVF